MSSKEKYKQSGHTQIVQKRSESNNKTNNSNSYSYQKVVVQKSIKTSYNTNVTNYNQRSMNNQNKSTEYKIQSKIPVNKNQTHNKNIYQSKDVGLYEYTSGNTYNINSNLKHHPQIIDFITLSQPKQKKQRKHIKVEVEAQKEFKVQALLEEINIS